MNNSININIDNNDLPIYNLLKNEIEIEKLSFNENVSNNYIPTVNINDFNSIPTLYDTLFNIGKNFGAIKIISTNTSYASTINHNSSTYYNIKKNSLNDTNIIDFYYDLYLFNNYHTIDPSYLLLIEKYSLDLYTLNYMILSSIDSIHSPDYWILLVTQLGYDHSIHNFLKIVYYNILLPFNNFDKNILKTDKKKKQKMNKNKNINSYSNIDNNLKFFKTHSSTSSIVNPNSTSSHFFQLNKPHCNLNQFIEKDSINFNSLKNSFPSNNISLNDFEIILSTINNNNNNTLITPLNSTFINNNNNNNPIFSNFSLKNFSLNNNSLLNYLNNDNDNLTFSKISLNSFLSFNNWSTSNFFLPNVHYNHFGSSKLWYFIPESEFDKFNTLLKNININSTTKSSNSINDDQFFLSDFYNLSKLITTTSNNNFFKINSKFLIDNNIKFTKIIQEPNSIILTFPKTFTTNISLGFNITESSNFAPELWLTSLLDNLNYNKNNSLTTDITNFNSSISHPYSSSFNPFKFIIDIILSSISKQSNILSKLKYQNNFNSLFSKKNLLKISDNSISILLKFITDYLYHENINKIKLKNILNHHNIINFNQILIDDNDSSSNSSFISDLSLNSTFASKIAISKSNNNNIIYVLSLNEFLSEIDIQNNNLFIFNTKLTNSSNIFITLHTLLDDDISLSLINFANNHFDNFLNDIQNNNHNNDNTNNNILEIFNNQINFNDFTKLINDNLNNNNTNEDTFSILMQYYQLIKNIKQVISYYNENNKSILTTTNHSIIENPFHIIDLKIPRKIYSTNYLKYLKRKLDISHINISELEQFSIILHQIDETELIFQNAMTFDKIEDISNVLNKYIFSPIETNFDIQLLNHYYSLQWSTIYSNNFTADNKLITVSSLPNLLTNLFNYYNFGLKYSNIIDKNQLHCVGSVIKQIEKLFKECVLLFKDKDLGSSLSLSQIVYITQLLKITDFTAEDSLLQTLQSIIDSISKIGLTVPSIYDQLEVNTIYVDALIGELLQDKIEVLPFLAIFDGSKADLRLQLQNILDHDVLKNYAQNTNEWQENYERLIQEYPNTDLINTVSTSLNIENDIYSPASENGTNVSQIYCFCRKGEGIGTMVQCEVCKEWYHQICINDGNWSVPTDDNKVFVCSICHPADLSQIIESSHLDFKVLQNLLLDSLKLKVIENRLAIHSIVNIYAQVLSFRFMLKRNLFVDGAVSKTVPISLIKFFLRKLHGSGLKMPDISNLLRQHISNSNIQEDRNLRSKNLLPITGYE